MRTLSLCVFLFAVSLTAACAAETKLPEPQKTGGAPVLTAIDNRGSAVQNTFPTGAVGDQELSTILWAASGNNRDSDKWTVPMGMGRQPYCKIYVASDAGVYRYDWKNHALVEVSKDNVKAAIPMQGFVKEAPVSLYLVVDGAEMAKLNNPMTAEWGALLAGAMSQNIFLAAEAVGVGTRIVYSIDRDEAAKRLRLDATDTALFVMPMGKR